MVSGLDPSWVLSDVHSWQMQFLDRIQMLLESQSLKMYPRCSPGVDQLPGVEVVCLPFLLKWLHPNHWRGTRMVGRFAVKDKAACKCCRIQEQAEQAVVDVWIGVQEG